MSSLLNRSLLLVGGVVVGGTVWGLVAAAAPQPQPAVHACYDMASGTSIALSPPKHVVGVGLSYAQHIAETGSPYTPDQPPPLFDKRWTPTTSTTALPTRDEQLAAAAPLEASLGASLEEQGIALQPLLDYEVELGIVVLEDISPAQLADPDYIPQLGFFVANDVSERSLAILGDGQRDPIAYWGVSKSFPGFLPTGTHAWVPTTPVRDGLPCVQLKTTVNGELRQDGSTRDLIYNTTALLEYAATQATLTAGTWVLTGTPSGVAIQTPGWKVRLSNMLGMDRFDKLSIKQGEAADFLQPGDVVVVQADGLGSVRSEIVAP